MIDYLDYGAYTVAPECVRICNALKLPLSQRALYQFIFSYCKYGKKKECTFSLEAFEAWTGLSHTGVINAIAALEEKKLIKRDFFFRDDSAVARRKYMLVETVIKNRADFKAEVRAKQQMRLEELRKQKADKALRAQGLQPVPPEYEGQGYKGIEIDSTGNKWLVPDGTVSSRNFRERYYTKEEFAAMAAERTNIDDWDI